MMEKIQARSINILMPLLFGMVFTIIIMAMRKPILHEIMIALYIISFIYFVFIFSCLYLNIGFKRSRRIEFADIPGLTKDRKWFHELRQTDGGTSGIPDVDHPIVFLIGIVILIIAPTILAVVIFVFSGAIEIVVFMSAIVFYYSFFKALRIQVLKRKETKQQFFKSLAYALFYTSITIGFLPIILTIFNTIYYR